MFTRLPRAARAALCLAASATATLVLPTLARAAQYQTDAVTPWKTNAAPMGWSASENRIFYNSLGADGLWDAYSAAPDGGDVRCLTCTAPVLPGAGANTDRGVSGVDPQGDLMLLEVERGSHFGSIGAPQAAPGRGAYNDVWLARADASQAWPLTDIYAPGSNAIGTMWARFDHTGTRIVWAEMYEPAILNLGAWRLKTADIVWDAGVPHLANIETFEPEPGLFIEPYGFSPDDQSIIFASDLGMPSWMDSQIWTVKADFSGAPQRLSPPDAPTGFFSDYNEFAFYVPQDDDIVYGRTVGSSTGGLDYWVMSPDGSEQQRLTYFNERWNVQGLGGYSAVGGLAFDPNDPNRFVAGVATNMTGSAQNAYMVDIGRYDSPQGLQAQYFAGSSVSAPVLSRIENPSVGFRWLGAPAPGLSTDFSARWTGSIRTDVTGTYQFCVRASEGARLWLDGQEVIDAPYAMGAASCAAVARSAGEETSVRLDYSNLWGPGLLQLYWVPPGTAASAAIPAGQMSPVGDGMVGPPAAAGSQTAAAPATGTVMAPGAGSPPAPASTAGPVEAMASPVRSGSPTPAVAHGGAGRHTRGAPRGRRRHTRARKNTRRAAR